MFKRLLLYLDHIIERAGFFALLFSGILMLVMSWLSAYGVGRRYLLNNPEPYSYELSTIFLVACVVLAIAGVQRLGQHLRADFLFNYFSHVTQVIVRDIISPVLALFYIGIVTWQGWNAAWYSLQVHEVSQSAWREPWWPTKMVVPIGTGLLCLVLVAQLVRGVTILVRRVRKTGP